MADFAYLEDDNELGITNYEEYFNEIFEDYLRLASFTRLPEFRDTEEELPETSYQWGKTTANILIKNSSKPVTGLCTLFAEHWMIFREDMDPAIIRAINGGEERRIATVFSFSLHTFTEVKANFSFTSVEAWKEFCCKWESGEIRNVIVQELKKSGYEDPLCIRYFNSDMAKEIQ